MRTKDLGVIILALAFISLFALVEPVQEAYDWLNGQHGMVAAFLKFALLATFGEMLAARIRSGQYVPPGFGLLPRAVVWGILGLTVKLAFVIFATGVPTFLAYLGLAEATEALAGPMGPQRVLVALAVSAVMNTVYAPVMMLTHKITDMHIAEWQGGMGALTHRIHVVDILRERIDWKVQWNFVFAKTIPLFWIPAHTISFLLPADMRTLFAAVLSIALGLILAFASKK
ncbi:MAG: hypothetical protein CSA07_02715 [Bacteroidia bacterium]|nr:MAG: hypothetical protein CSA07_02715 [Bacteroidia bacterium]